MLAVHVDAKRVHVQHQMQMDHQVTSAARAGNRRAEAQLAQARQVSEHDLTISCSAKVCY